MDKETLLAHMPTYYKTSKVIENLSAANAAELTAFKSSLENLLDQFFIDTADTSIERWETELGITVNNAKDINYRRSVIKSKLRGSGTATIKLIQNVSASFSNGDVDVIEDNENYCFTIKFVGTLGIPPNMDDLEKAIEEIKPAHLAYTFEYTYTTWGQVKSLSWDQVKAGTWESLKTREVV